MFQKKFFIDDFLIGGSKCYVIAEAGVNHFGSLKKAYQLIDLAKESGADSFKIQHFSTEELINKKISPEWFDRLKMKELSDKDVTKIYERCKKKNINFLCTPHTYSKFLFLEKLNVSAYKIGSGELKNYPFIQHICKSKKPVIISTGMYEKNDIKELLKKINNLNRKIAILHCSTAYPTKPINTNLQFMNEIKKFFPGPVGFSDHSIGYHIPLSAVALGAKIIEKHITLDINVPNAQDWKVSCNRQSFPIFVNNLRDIEAAINVRSIKVDQDQKKSLKWATKSIYCSKDINIGDKITLDKIEFKRPGIGLPPSNVHLVLGKKTTKKIKKDSILKINALKR